MLVLTRRIGETLIIGNDVFIKITGVKGNQVRIGISAPEHVEIHREEVWLAIQESRKEAK